MIEIDYKPFKSFIKEIVALECSFLDKYLFYCNLLNDTSTTSSRDKFFLCSISKLFKYDNGITQQGDKIFDSRSWFKMF